MDYSLCDQTVTIYRWGQNGLVREVADGCYYIWEDRQQLERPGGDPERRFLLIMPGSMQRVFSGDRVYPGVGPEEVYWPTFLPINVPGLSVVQYTCACRWGGEVCHIEAGRK